MKFAIFALLVVGTVAIQEVASQYKNNGNEHWTKCRHHSHYAKKDQITPQRASSASGYLGGQGGYTISNVQDSAWWGSRHRGVCKGSSRLCSSRGAWAVYTGNYHGRNQWLVFDFSTPKSIDKVMIDHWGARSNWLHAPKTVSVQVSNYQGGWHNCHTFNTQTTCAPVYYKMPRACPARRYARLYLHNKHRNDSPYVVLDEVIFYGSSATKYPTAYPTNYPTTAPTHWCSAKSTCKTTTCQYSAGQTHVFQKFLDDSGTPIRAPEHWHCEKTPCGCSCKCAASLNCNLRHHHTSGYKKDFEHCTPTPAPTAYPTPQPTAYPTSQPTQHCQVSGWGPWTDCETTGTGGHARVWSGGCRHHATGGGWRYYCLNGVDQNTASGYGYTHGDSNFRIQRAGFWRVNFYADHHGSGTHYHVRIQVNGRDIYYNHNYKWHDGGWSQLHGDVTWRMRAGWRFQVSMHGRHYIWHAWNHFHRHPWHSRAQFIYLGANLKMWSGGCRHHCRHCTGWHTYCLNGQDTWDSTHNPSGYMTHDHWRVYARRTGFFRINFFAIQHGWPGYFQSRVLVSGRTIYYNHNYRWWHEAGWSTVDMDVFWRINNGQNVQIQMYSPNNRGNVYTWHAWNHYGQHSRLQMTWKGTNMIMWSGGCRHHMVASGWRDYCLNGQDYNNCGGNCWTPGNQYMYLRKQGFWNVKFYTIQHGHLGHARLRFQHNHRDVLYTHRYKWHNSGWSQIMGDMTWWFNHNDHVRISIHTDRHGWQWHSWNYHGQHSRVQFVYQGGTQGMHYRQRFVTKQPANGGNGCPSLVERKSCEA